MNQIEYAAAALAVWNIIVFAMYGVDKHKAKYGSRRISEVTLLTSAALMGALGALLGMQIFRHKTRHAKFKLGVPILLVANITAVIIALHIIGM